MEHTIELIAFADDAACAIDRTQRITAWNRSAEELLGYAPDEVRGKPCFRIFCASDETGCSVCSRTCKVLRALRTRETIGAREVLTHAKNGRELWLSISTLIVPPDWCDVSAIIYFMRDITHRIIIQKDLRQLVQDVAVGDGKRVRANWPDHGDDMHLMHQLNDDMIRTMAALSGREQQVLRLLASGLRTADIAASLFISEATVRNHIQHIFSKLGVHHRVAAVTLALRNALV